MKITITMTAAERNAIANICTTTAKAALVDEKKIPDFHYEMDKALIVPETKVIKHKAYTTTYDYKDSKATIAVDIRPDAMRKALEFVDRSINKFGALVARGLAIIKTCTSFIEDMKAESKELDKIFEYTDDEKLYCFKRIEVGGYGFVAVYSMDPDLNVDFYELRHASLRTPEKYVDVALGMVHADVDVFREESEDSLKNSFTIKYKDVEEWIDDLLYSVDEDDDDEEEESDNNDTSDSSEEDPIF